MKLTNLDLKLLQLLINSKATIWFNKNGDFYRVKLYINKYKSSNFNIEPITLCGRDTFNLLEKITLTNEKLKQRYKAILPYKKALTTRTKYSKEEKIALDNLHKELSCYTK